MLTKAEAEFKKKLSAIGSMAYKMVQVASIMEVLS
jgi:hypothetical protein